MATAGFKGVAIKKALWAAAKATTPQEFDRKMQELAEIDLDAAKWLDDKPPNEWSRAYFKTDVKCDMLLNNNCESFNSKILDERALPIVSMFEGLRLYLMKRMQENRDRARRLWRDKIICPRIFKKGREKGSKGYSLCFV